MKAIIVHGGAGDIKRKDEVPERIEACKTSASKGFQKLLQGNSSIDAVVEAVKYLEQHPLFDAGVGSYLNEEGFVELDAAIMDGFSLKIGAVAGIRHVKSPVELARMIMEKSKHSFLIGEGAEKFARLNGLEIVSNEYFFSERAKKIFENRYGDTVGAVALDDSGHITVAVSTGGTAFKMVGRVGDSPIVGSGFYANNFYGAVATGIGEEIMKAVLSFRIMLYIDKGLTEASNKAIEDLSAVGGHGGLIALDQNGNFAFPHNTEGMFYAYIKEGMNGPEAGV